MNFTKIPYAELPITLVLKSTNRKVYRDLYCLECGHPFVAISDKIISLIDVVTPMELLQPNEMVVEARCRQRYCGQYYRFEV